MKYTKILICSVLFFTMFSCKKVIDVKETDLIAGDIALLTATNDLQVALNGIGPAFWNGRYNAAGQADFSQLVRDCLAIAYDVFQSAAELGERGARSPPGDRHGRRTRALRHTARRSVALPRSLAWRVPADARRAGRPRR